MTRFAFGDRELLTWLAKFPYLRAADLVFLTGRSKFVIWRRLGKLKELGFADYVKHPENSFLRLWFLTRKGWEKAGDQKLVDFVLSATDQKGHTNVLHELLITELFLGLIRAEREGYISDLQFTRLYQRLHVKGLVNPDAAFSFRIGEVHPFFFVEVERTDQHSYEKGISNLIAKAEGYAAYPADLLWERYEAEDFFTVYFMASDTKARNFIRKLQVSENHALRTRKFWAVAMDAIFTPLAKVYYTPKDEGLSLTDSASFLEQE